MPDDPGSPADQQASDRAEPLDGPVRHVERDGGGAFIVERDGERMAELTYAIDHDGSAILNHTYVSDELRGQGMALKLTMSAVQWARSSNTKVVPVCSFARAVFERHQELADVLRD